MPTEVHLDDVRAWRRHLHRHPELSFHEFDTTDFIEERLRAFGLAPYRLAPTGVLADIGEGAPRIALRADIDALPIDEATGAPYASERPGSMHACGHDAHAAMLLGAARALAAQPPGRGSVRLLFQAAEELPPGGAQVLVKAGALAGVERVFGVHVDATLPLGRAEIGPGRQSANSDRFEIRLMGSGGHASRPQETVDAVLMAGQLIVALQSIVARSVDPLASAVVSVGRVEAGRASNVIAGEARLFGSVRTFEPEVQAVVERRLGELAEGVAQSFGGRAELRYEPGYPSVLNAEDPAALFAQAAREVLGADQVAKKLPELGGEDFGFYAREVPGAFLWLGSASPGRDFPHHSPHFDVDEGVLELGVRLWLRLVELALGPAAP